MLTDKLLEHMDSFNRILIRTNLGEAIGYGHMKRCMSLVNHLKKIKNFEVVWVINDEETIIEDEKIVLKENEFNIDEITIFNSFSPDIVIIDSYIPNYHYVSFISRHYKTILFDDTNRFITYPVDIVINGNIYAHKLQYNRNEKTTFLLGMDYLFLGVEYDNIPPVNYESNTILVTSGTTDDKNVIPKFAELLKDMKDYKITFVVGKYFKDSKNTIELIQNISSSYNILISPSHLDSYILSSEIVISTSGTSAYEVLRCNRKLICYQTTENQNLIGKSIEEEKLGINLGWYDNITEDNLIKALDKVKSS